MLFDVTSQKIVSIFLIISFIYFILDSQFFCQLWSVLHTSSEEEMKIVNWEQDLLFPTE